MKVSTFMLLILMFTITTGGYALNQTSQAKTLILQVLK